MASGLGFVRETPWTWATSLAILGPSIAARAHGSYPKPVDPAAVEEAFAAGFREG